ncbi:MAG: hypothetical protein V1822_03760 [Candidatus Micrarchaeota archaeon]
MAMRQFVLKRKPVAIILCLKDSDQRWYPSKIAKYSGASYVYVTNWLTKLETAGWVAFEKKGRLKAVSLTEHGKVIASLLDELVKKMDQNPQNRQAAPKADAPKLA